MRLQSCGSADLQVGRVVNFNTYFCLPLTLSAGWKAGARAPTMACCQHGESPCGGFTLTPKSKLTASSRGGVGSKLR